MTTTTLVVRAVRGSAPPPITISDRDHDRILRLIDAGPHDAEQLAGELSRAHVVPTTLLPRDVITMGSTVLYEDTATGAQREITLVYPDNADASAGRVSVLAPIGSALLGLRVGDAIDWELPSKRKARLRVMRLTHQER